MVAHAARVLAEIAPLRAARLADEFTLVINGTLVFVSGSDAAALSPAVALQLSVDSRAKIHRRRA
jgi:hypothetical protein